MSLTIVVATMLNCPIGLISGTTGNADVTGCEDGTLLWSSDSADLIVTPQPNGNANLTVAITGSGVANVSVTCTIDGNSETFSCPINLVPQDQVLVCEVSPPLIQSFETCGQLCDCGSVTLNFDCEEFNICDSVIVSVEVKDCEQPDPEPCPPSTPLQLKANQ